MNQNKIGMFIASLRKERHMTQQELANLLHVTDRAVSNWENGRRMPDVSLFKPLCEALGISVSELVNGEKIAREKRIETSEEALIDTLHTNKKNQIKSKHTISFLFLLLFLFLILIVFLFIAYKKAYPRIDIYFMDVTPSDIDEDMTRKKQFKIKRDNEEVQVYYYGIDAVQLCDNKQNCFELKKAIDLKQTNIEEIKKYLESQSLLEHLERYTLYDGGTTFYQNKAYSIILCNTLEGNKDIYIGPEEMPSKLNGEYCGHAKNREKSFIRTYFIVSVTEDDDEDFVNVTLKQFQGEEEHVKINKSYSIVVGKSYEFTFLTFHTFEDTISNIFEHATLLEVNETDKIGLEQTNDSIYVNDSGRLEETSEIPNVFMEIKEGTLTKKSATVLITDLNKNQYIYGEEFRIDKKEKEDWTPLEPIHENCAFNAIAYHVDQRGKLELTHDWSYRYGKLGKGKYRLVKYAFPNLERAVTEEDKKYFFVEFTIE